MMYVCVFVGSQESDSSQTAKKDMLAALRARQEALEETLRQRIEELKSICIREAVRIETTSHFSIMALLENLSLLAVCSLHRKLFCQKKDYYIVRA